MHERFLRELCQRYQDRVDPGLQTAWLPNKEVFYVAVHRFPTNVASRTVVAKALAPTLEEAIQKCYDNWRTIVEFTPEKPS